MRTTTDEISLSGCYIETMFTMDVATKLIVTLSICGDTVHAEGVVVTKYPQVGNGIDFTQMTRTTAASWASLSRNMSRNVMRQVQVRDKERMPCQPQKTSN
jgi:hypothetical protein